MKLKKNIISRQKAISLAPDYVKFIDGNSFSARKIVMEKFKKLRAGQSAITYINGQFVLVKVRSVGSGDLIGTTEPVVSVDNDEYIWRTNGNKYAFPIKTRDKQNNDSRRNLQKRQPKLQSRRTIRRNKVV